MAEVQHCVIYHALIVLIWIGFMTASIEIQMIQIK